MKKSFISSPLGYFCSGSVSEFLYVGSSTSCLYHIQVLDFLKEKCLRGMARTKVTFAPDTFHHHGMSQCSARYLAGRFGRPNSELSALIGQIRSGARLTAAEAGLRGNWAVARALGPPLAMCKQPDSILNLLGGCSRLSPHHICGHRPKKEIGAHNLLYWALLTPLRHAGHSGDILTHLQGPGNTL